MFKLFKGETAHNPLFAKKPNTDQVPVFAPPSDGADSSSAPSQSFESSSKSGPTLAQTFGDAGSFSTASSSGFSDQYGAGAGLIAPVGFDLSADMMASFSAGSGAGQLLPLGPDSGYSESDGGSISLTGSTSTVSDGAFASLATFASAVYATGTTAAATTAASAGLVINLLWDTSVASAPASFKTAIQAAASMIQQYVTTPITVNIAVGWGEIGGFGGNAPYTVPGYSALGETLGGVWQSYSSVKQALTNTATSADDKSVLAALPSSSPFGTAMFDVAGAQAKALGLISATSTQVDGAVGFATNWPSTDYIAAALHEITHAMGRNSGWGGTNGDTSLLDLTRFSAPGVFATDGSKVSSSALQYFSLDGGKTILANYDNTSDYGDFATTSATANDPNNAYLGSNSNALTQLDIRTLDVMGFNLAGSSPTPPPTPSSPDLVVSSLTPAATSVTQGSALAFTYAVTDTGAGAAGSSLATVYLDGKALSSTQIAALAAGGSSSVNGSLSTTGLTLGQHSLSVTADSTGLVSESNETNNSTAITFTVVGNTSPDLVVSSLTSTTSSVVAGGTLSFSYTVKDIGTAGAGASAVGISLDGKALSSAQISALTAGGSFSSSGIISTTGLAAGSHVLTVTADTTGLVTESNEANNATSLAFTVTAPALADLTVSGLATNAATVTQGASLGYSYSIQDIGSAAANASVTNIMLDGRLISSTPLGTVGAGGNVMSFGSLSTAGLSAGQHILSVTTDANGQVSESNESNNTSSVSFTVNTTAIKADLVIAGLTSVSPTSMVQGDILAFYYSLNNTGSATAGTSVAAYQVDTMPTASNYRGYNSFGSIAANSSGGSVIDYLDTSKLSVGSHTLYLVADAGNQISETNETNNVSSFTFNVLSKPDYVVNAINMPATIKAGSKFTLNYTVSNTGTTQPWSSSYATIYFDGNANAVNYDIIKNLAGNTSQNFSDVFSVGAGVAKGTHTVTITADATNYIGESNETNNSKTIQFQIV
jgi:hypothetical protein